MSTSQRSTYTAAQLATLDTVKDPAFALGIARQEFVNHVLEADGSITDSPAAFAAILDEAIAGLVADASAESLAAAAEAARLKVEIAEHIAQARFLFVVGDAGIPIIYFQCATPDNPDLPSRVEAH